MNKPIFTMLVGIPGSGKSTWIRDNKGDSLVVSPDHVRFIICSDISDQTLNDVVWKTALYITINNLLNGKDTILDATNVNTRLRKQFLEKLPECEKHAILFDIDPAIAYERIHADRGLSRANVPEEIVYRMYGEYLFTKKVLRKEFDKIMFAFPSRSCNFFEISTVDANYIKSKWQAHFFQVFPIDMDSLPETHESDRECFEKYWRGNKNMTYDEFIKRQE